MPYKLFIKIRIILVVGIFFIITNKSWALDSAFSCGGKVENEAWQLWDGSVKNYLLKDLLHDRLLKQGDVYALYDFQEYIHNLVAMARRCNRIIRLQEMARVIDVAYTTLEPSVPVFSGLQWVCHGGSICGPGLLNKEVFLDTAQFLGVATSIANALATSGGILGEEDRLFIKNTALIATEHLLRWSNKVEFDLIRTAKKTSVQDDNRPQHSFFPTNSFG